MNDFMKIYEQLQSEWKKRVKPHKCLGVALSETALFAGEVHRKKEEYTLGKRARFEFPEGASLDRPVQLGEAVKQFLKENGFTARKVAVGLPAKWIMTREMNLPPSPVHVVSGAMKIHAEREFSLGPDDLALDYTGVIHPDRPSRLMLSAMLKKRMRQIQEVANAAGLEVLSISSSSASLFTMAAEQVSGGVKPRLALFMRPAYAELLVASGEEIVEVKYFQKREQDGGKAFIAEMGRALALGMKALPEGEAPRLFLWAGPEASVRDVATDIAGAVPSGMAVVEFPVGEVFEKYGLSEEGGDMNDFGPPLALARWVFREPVPSVADFLNSRMEVKTGRIEKRHVRIASIVAAVLVLFLVGMIVSWKMNLNDVAKMKANLADMAPEVDTAHSIVDRISSADKWYDGRPRVLDCMRALTLIFPEEGSIWTSSVALNEEMSGIISGKALDEQNVIDVLDEMKKSDAFSDVQMIYLRDSGKDSQQITFSMSFVYVGV
jgi:hypothetical protein